MYTASSSIAPVELPPDGLPRPIDVIEAIPTAIVVVDRRGQVVSANAAAGRAFGAEPARLVGRSVGTLVHASSLGSLAGWAETALAAGRFQAEVRCQHAAGAVFEAALVATPLAAPTSEVCYLVALTDVSEQRRMRRELTQYARTAAMSRFITSIAHELNNPLQVILGNAERLLASDAPVGPTRALVLESMRDYSLRAADVVRGLQVFVRPRSEHRTLVLAHAVVEAVLARREAALARDGITVGRAWDTTAAVMADGPMLEEVVAHLVANAADAMRPRGGGALSVEVVQRGRVVTIRVGDTGPGVAPDLRARIFEPFFTTKGPGAGTGLGLAICHGIVSEHGGTLQVSEGPGGGAVFSVEIPAAPISGVDPFQVQ